MNIRKALVFGIISAFFLTAATASAATSDNRYFIKSNSSFLKKSFAARNVFEDGFTADLSGIQLKMAKIFGVEVQSVKKLNILATTPSPAPAAPVKSKTPSEQIPWGVQYIYDSTLGEVPTGGEGVTVAILDTGINKNHPDLKKRVTQCVDFSSSVQLEGKCEDKNDHGTHVAGIVAADGGPESKGIYGLAPSANLAIYKVCNDDGTCFADDVAAGIRFAADQKAQVILVSVGSDIESLLIHDAVVYAANKGSLIVAAAGNEGPDTDTIDYPAAQPEIVSVTALDAKSNVPEWSSRGANDDSKSFVRELGDVEFVAPGVNIESTGKDGDYVVLSGTSMSAAHIAGLAAKVWQVEEKQPAEATRDLLHQFSSDVGYFGDDSLSGWGTPIL